MVTQKSKFQVRPARNRNPVQSSASLVSSIFQGKKKIILLVVFAAILVIGITSLVIFDKQFVGKAIDVSSAELKPGEAGIPLAGASMKVNDMQSFTVYANLGNDDAYGFSFELNYDPIILEYSPSTLGKAKESIAAKKGLTILREVHTTGTISVAGMSTMPDKQAVGGDLETLKEIAGNGLVPLVTFQFKAKQKGENKFSFSNFVVPNIEDNRNLVVTPKSSSVSVLGVIGKSTSPTTKKTVPLGGIKKGEDTREKTSSEETSSNSREVCNNKKDDDGDKKIDCSDEDCVLTPGCQPLGKCMETDGGNNPNKKGTLTTTDGIIFTDSCSLDGKSPVSLNNEDKGMYIYEHFCDEKKNNQVSIYPCPGEATCEFGKCVAKVTGSPSCLAVYKIAFGDQSFSEYQQKLVCESAGCTYSEGTLTAGDEKCLGTPTKCPYVAHFQGSGEKNNNIRRELCESVFINLQKCTFIDGATVSPAKYNPDGDSCSIYASEG